MKPTIPITDKRFVYVPAHQTDIRQTFARIRADMVKAKGTHPWALYKGKA